MLPPEASGSPNYLPSSAAFLGKSESAFARVLGTPQPPLRESLRSTFTLLRRPASPALHLMSDAFFFSLMAAYHLTDGG